MKGQALILAGGKGQRLWPYSTPEKPKQFLKLGAHPSLLGGALARVEGLVERAYVVSLEEQREVLKEALGDFPEERLIFEPSGKNTAPCIFFALSTLLQRGDWERDSLVAIVPSDHEVLDERAFHQSLSQAMELSLRFGSIATLGVIPSRPHTGYGYIKRGEEVAQGGYFIERFEEKPCLERAQEYVSSGEYYWNSGIFVATVGAFLEEFATKTSFGPPEEFLKRDYREVESISFDHAIMEESPRALVIPTRCQWSDLGSWEAFESVLPSYRGNTFIGSQGEHVLHSSGNIIFSPHQKVSLVGVEDVVVVSTPEHLLVMKKGLGESIKNLF